MRNARALSPARPAPAITPASAQFLQRKCACGGALSVESECLECQKSRAAQRKPSLAEDVAPAEALPARIERVLRAPGEPLSAAARAFMEPRFGRDFGGVRLHTGPAAAESATALQARAYTLGGHIVLRDGEALRETPDGRALLAHELTHVCQQSGSAAPGADLRQPENGHLEQEAVAHEALAHQTVPRAQPAFSVGNHAGIQRSPLGGTLGGIAGTLGGILVGGAIGGLAGAIVGGVVGLIGGAVVGDKLSTKERKLTPEEIKYCEEIFGKSVDLEAVTITRDSLFSIGAPKTIGNTIHLRSDPDWAHFDGAGLKLSADGLRTLVHELGHVWQYQHGGLDYIPASLIAQYKAWRKGGKRGDAYHWQEPYSKGDPWEKWNPEQQASAIEDYNINLRIAKDPTACSDNACKNKRTAAQKVVTILEPYMVKVRNGEGAP